MPSTPDSRSSSPTSLTIALFSAHEPELDGFVTLLGPERRAVVYGFDVRASAVGIGLAASAIGATARLVEAKPDAAIFVGTAGAYDGHHLALGDVVIAREVVLASGAVAEGRGGYPTPMPVRARCHRELADGLARALERPALPVDVATTLAVTTDDALAATLSRSYGCAVEHLEAAAFGLACEAAGVAFAVVLGIANRVGAGGRDEWKKHHREAGLQAAQLVGAWLARGAPGLRK